MQNKPVTKRQILLYDVSKVVKGYNTESNIKKMPGTNFIKDMQNL